MKIRGVNNKQLICQEQTNNETNLAFENTLICPELFYFKRWKQKVNPDWRALIAAA